MIIQMLLLLLLLLSSTRASDKRYSERPAIQSVARRCAARARGKELLSRSFCLSASSREALFTVIRFKHQTEITIALLAGTNIRVRIPPRVCFPLSLFRETFLLFSISLALPPALISRLSYALSPLSFEFSFLAERDASV